MKKKKLKLKKGIKKAIKNITIIIILLVNILIFINLIQNNLNDMYKRCDEAKGHVCSYYEARQYINNK